MLYGSDHRIVHIPKRESPAVERASIRLPRADFGSNPRIAAIGSDHQLGSDLIALARKPVTYAHGATIPPDHFFDEALFADVGTGFAGGGHQAQVLFWTRDTQTVIYAMHRGEAFP
jgi:hypothetical protein